MINSLQSWSFQVCAVAVIAAICNMLFPSLEKYGVFSLLKVIMLLCVIRIFLPAIYSIETDGLLNEESFTVSDAQNVYILEFSNALSMELLKNINAAGINAEDIRIDFSVNEDGYSIDGIGIIPTANADLTADAERLSKEWGAPVYVLKTEGGT